jgi:orotidine-5'-phosphate decarboxylase
MVSSTTFHTLLTSREREANSLLCVGLDPVLAKLPVGIAGTADGVADFCIEIVNATKDFVSCFKPNLPFYLSLGESGLRALRRVREAIPANIPMVLDCKVNDLGDTAQEWVRTAFEVLEADAIVVAPYMGEDALAPYFNCDGKGVIVLVKTSNPGSGDLQDLQLASGQPLYMHVAERCRVWQQAYPADVGMVVGATWPEQLQSIRERCPDQVILLPGLGAQGGNVAASVRAGIDAGGGSLLCSSSRGILYASSGPDFAEFANIEAQRLRDEINLYRHQPPGARKTNADTLDVGRDKNLHSNSHSH